MLTENIDIDICSLEAHVMVSVRSCLSLRNSWCSSAGHQHMNECRASCFDALRVTYIKRTRGQDPAMHQPASESRCQSQWDEACMPAVEMTRVMQQYNLDVVPFFLSKLRDHIRDASAVSFTFKCCEGYAMSNPIPRTRFIGGILLLAQIESRYFHCQRIDGNAPDG